ncbi:MAG: hypothetical protein AB1485_07130 [Candidatus Thermoplasmatota archaeon]
MLKDNKAQAGAVGVMLAILIILTIISVITLHYAPVWMKEKEANHMATVANQFCDLQKAINNLIISGDTTTDISASFSLGVEGMPLLGIGATTGTLEIDPYTSKFVLKNASGILNITASGRLKFISGNRYYPRQSFIYENSAVIVEQSEGNSLKGVPELSIYNISGIRMILKLVSIQSTKKEVLSGSGIQAIKFKLVCSEYEEYKEYPWDVGETLEFNISSERSDVWETIFNSTVKRALLNESIDYKLTKGKDYVALTLYSVKMLGVRFVGIEARLY